VLLDVVTTPDGKIAETGLDGLMAECGVQVGNDRIISTRSRNGTSVQLRSGLEQSHRAGSGVQRGRPADGPQRRPHDHADPWNGAEEVRADALFVNMLPDSWAEMNLAASPRALAEDLRKPDRAEELKAKVKKDLPVAVTVVDAPAGAPGAKEEESARLVVVGDADWIDSTNIQQSGGGFASIFLNMVLWLHGRPDLGELPARQDPDKFELTAIKNEDDYFRIRTLSGGLMVVSILALGAGIWVVRRR
jgi:hypothetical protein